MDEVIEIKYAPRVHQQQIHDLLDAKRFAVVVAHRRFGKTVSAINHLIRDAVLNTSEAPRYAYIAPTYSQAKRIAWDYLIKYVQPLGAVVNIAELRVDFWGRRIQLYGSDNPESLRGQYFDGVILDEYGDQSPVIWTDIIRPAIVDRKGWTLFIGTPKGHNHFRELRDRALKDEDWGLLEFKASETNVVDAKELHAARIEMGEDKYRQEFECSFTAALEGSYFGQIINQLEDNNHIQTIPRRAAWRYLKMQDLKLGLRLVCQSMTESKPFVACCHGAGLMCQTFRLGLTACETTGARMMKSARYSLNAHCMTGHLTALMPSVIWQLA